MVVNGCLLKSGIPAYARFGGLLQIKEGKPFRFSDLVEFSGTTVDPSDIFMVGRMTGVINAGSPWRGKDTGRLSRDTHALGSKAEEILQRMKNSNLINMPVLARPGEKICEMPFSQEKVGLVTLSGFNPAAAAAEAGIEVENRSMCGMMEVLKMRPVNELI